MVTQQVRNTRRDTTRSARRCNLHISSSAERDLTRASWSRLTPVQDKLMPPCSASWLCAARKTDESCGRNCGRRRPVFPTKPWRNVWKQFSANIFIAGILRRRGLQKLEGMLTSFGSGPLRENLLFYLATHRASSAGRRGTASRGAAQRKAPAGSASSSKSRSATTRLRARAEQRADPYAHESQVCRIDHYLGKETVANI